MPIPRLTDRQAESGAAPLGLHPHVEGKTIDKETGKPKKIMRDVINAMSEKLTSSYRWKWSFKERRCLIPMSSRDGWPKARNRTSCSVGRLLLRDASSAARS